MVQHSLNFKCQYKHFIINFTKIIRRELIQILIFCQPNYCKFDLNLYFRNCSFLITSQYYDLYVKI